ncbi:MAG: VCBS repeat-containing protein [Flavobacteriales bacterium]|nr:VCBS repeat-containing protein [Flavobacteriales bacterium]
MSVTRTLALFAASLPLLAAQAQFTFTNATALKSNTTNSGGCMGVVDINGDGLDDLCILHNSRIFMVDYQNADGSFTLVDYGSVSNDAQWGMTIADMQNTGHKDLVCGGSYDGVHYMRIPTVGQSTLANLNNGNMFMQCNNAVDINNDGHNDFWACHDDAAPRQWLNNGSGNLTYANIIDYTTNPATDMSGNYGSVWTDFDNDGDLDLYIAKCRQGVNNPNDPRRWNRLFVNDGNGNFTDMAESHGLQIKNQSWTADFGDIDNDGDLDMMLTNHDATIQLFENDGTGHFTEITAGSGLEITGFFLQSKFVDFDNDGYIDLLIAGGLQRLFRNNGNKTFTNVPNMFPANKAMHSFAIGDLNNDGFQDVFANYGSGYVTPDNNNPDRIWLNDGNDNNWLVVRLQGTESNRDAIGARVTITGPWGTQIREVRAGESYGIVCTFACHFGLGQQEEVPTVTVTWPSGLVETFNNIEANQTITIIEGLCISPQAEITTPTAPIVCGNGSTVTLTANPGFNYLWNTGAQTQSITVSQPGSYTVTINDGQGCTGTASIFVVQSPDETPTVSYTGETRFCEGGSLELTSTPAAGYSWTGGGNGQSLVVTQSGSYTVTIDGVCGQFTSAAVVVDVLDAPDAPIADDVVIPVPGMATLQAVGDNILWYDVPTGGNAIGSGNSFQTPFIANTTSFWATASIEHEGEHAYGSKTNWANQGQYHTNSDNYQFFTAYEPFTIVSVKVYANGAGNRNVALIDRTDGSIVVSQVINIPDGESRITLNFQVPAAGDYGLRTIGGNPQLWRDGLGSTQNYPYPLGTLGAVTSSSVAGANATAFYYFFYDWEVEATGLACESQRTEAIVWVGNVGIADAAGSGMVHVWPNPASDILNIGFGQVSGRVVLELMDITGRLVVVREQDGAALEQGILTLGVGGLSHGEYLLRVRDGVGSSVHRVMLH